MSAEIEFYGEVICDGCGEQGAYDVMGDYLCTRCLNANIPAEELFDEEEYREEDPTSY